jgi:hypothetical protein
MVPVKGCICSGRTGFGDYPSQDSTGSKYFRLLPMKGSLVGMCPGIGGSLSAAAWSRLPRRWLADFLDLPLARVNLVARDGCVSIAAKR